MPVYMCIYVLILIMYIKITVVMYTSYLCYLLVLLYSFICWVVSVVIFSVFSVTVDDTVKWLVCVFCYFCAFGQRPTTMCWRARNTIVIINFLVIQIFSVYQTYCLLNYLKVPYCPTNCLTWDEWHSNWPEIQDSSAGPRWHHELAPRTQSRADGQKASSSWNVKLLLIQLLQE